MKMSKFEREFMMLHMRQPTDKEMAGMLELPLNKVLNLKQVWLLHQAFGHAEYVYKPNPAPNAFRKTECFFAN